jgi:hypothetical protein
MGINAGMQYLVLVTPNRCIHVKKHLFDAGKASPVANTKQVHTPRYTTKRTMKKYLPFLFFI